MANNAGRTKVAGITAYFNCGLVDGKGIERAVMMARHRQSVDCKLPGTARVKLRRPLPIADIGQADVRLDLAYRYWKALGVDHHLLPNRHALDHAAFRFLVHGCVWINVESADPGNWDLVKILDLSKQPRSGGAGISWAEALLGDCRTTRFTGTVLFQRIELEDPIQGFEQLIMPLADDGIRVDTLLIVQAPDEVELEMHH